MNEARCTHYRPFIDKNSSDQSKLFRASKSLLNLQEDKSLPSHTNASVLANEMGEYFIHKVVAIRSKLAGDAVPHAVSTECAPHGSSSTDDVVTLSEFQSPFEEAVRKMAVASMKTCALDPFPSSILLLCIEELLPVITRMLNISLEHNYFADEWKKALVHPLLKNLVFQLINKNFRLVSNLQFTSKLTEKAVAVQLQEHMRVNGLFPEFQSAYRQDHSTETALLKVKNDLLMAMDKGQVTLWVLLNLTSAFDTVEHEILLDRLRSAVGLRVTVRAGRSRCRLTGLSQSH